VFLHNQADVGYPELASTPREHMNISTRLFDPTLVIASAVTILWLPVPSAFADCAKDTQGEVYCGAGRCARDSSGTIWCSRYHKGDAQVTLNGNVLCSKGQCAKSLKGKLFCSSEVNGAVLKDSDGSVRCQGRCETPSAAQCENTLADSAD